jgi:hypothetical protein
MSTFKDFLDRVSSDTAEGRLTPARCLFQQLLETTLKPMCRTVEEVKAAIAGQASVARRRTNSAWIREVVCDSQTLSLTGDHWIRDNVGHVKVRRSRPGFSRAYYQDVRLEQRKSAVTVSEKEQPTLALISEVSEWPSLPSRSPRRSSPRRHSPDRS